MRSTITIPALLLLLAMGSCSILNHSDQEKSIRSFMSEFEGSLGSRDSEILSFFSSSQSKQALLSAVRVLQNTDSLHVKCVAYFDQAQIVHDTSGIKVSVRALIAADTLDVHVTDTTEIAFYLKPVKGKLTIGRLGAEEFYDAYLRVKNQVVATLMQKEDEELYVNYYAAAKFLGQTYDEVKWAVRYGHESYFYVVSQGKMGLVDKTGRIIVPVKFDLVGTPGIAVADVVEVKLTGLTGYYSMDGKELISPEYDYIIPYEEDDVIALVHNEDGYGYVSKVKGVSNGFPSDEAKQYIKTFAYLKGIELSSRTQAAAEIPDEESVGQGFIMPPSYLVSRGFFPETLDYFSVGGSFKGNMESVSVSYSFVESVLQKVNAIVSAIEEHYLEGRQGFYTHRKIDFVDANGGVIATSAEIPGDITFKTIDSTLLEIKSEYVDNEMEMGMPEDESEYNIPTYYYYRLTDGAPDAQVSNRKFPFTEFVKLDESYIQGNFSYFDHQTQNWSTRTQLCDTTLMEMRDEILADYGYIFEDVNTDNHFRFFKWYAPRFNSIDEIRGSLSDVDAYNLKFLEERVGLPGKSPA